jgi:Holliday junction resolvase RusA-like endonuclease
MIEFVVPKRPVSIQAKNPKTLQEWKDFVYGRALSARRGAPRVGIRYKFTLVHLSEEDPPDINNVIKPVEDALNGLAYPDDKHVVDVTGHRRPISEGIDVTHLPVLLRDAVFLGAECIYVRVSAAGTLEDEL